MVQITANCCNQPERRVWKVWNPSFSRAPSALHPNARQIRPLSDTKVVCSPFCEYASSVYQLPQRFTRFTPAKSEHRCPYTFLHHPLIHRSNCPAIHSTQPNPTTHSLLRPGPHQHHRNRSPENL